jgi:diketogulonate reductase-like aldo/keto reductase
VTMAEIALAWVLNNPAVSAPIVGATKGHHLPDAVAALDLHLTAAEVQALEAPYTQHGTTCFRSRCCNPGCLRRVDRPRRVEGRTVI